MTSVRVILVDTTRPVKMRPRMETSPVALINPSFQFSILGMLAIANAMRADHNRRRRKRPRHSEIHLRADLPRVESDAQEGPRFCGFLGWDYACDVDCGVGYCDGDSGV